MNNLSRETLKGLRSAYKRLFLQRDNLLNLDCTGQAASDLVKRILMLDRPCMICRLGSVELNAVFRHVDIARNGSTIHKALNYIKGETGPFWWDDRIIRKMQKNTGFFPANKASLEKFCQRMLHDIKQIDILASWQQEDTRLRAYFPDAKVIHLHDLEPWRHDAPWSTALAGKKVLVVHPFSETITKQYVKHHLLFPNKDVLPDFDLITLKAVQSIGGTKTPFPTWFDALDCMCEQIKMTDFDIAIIGAGAYGLPLASFVKSIGKKGFHLGGATQLLFGIKGKRWDQQAQQIGLYNEYWVRASPNERPDNFKSVEKGCYW